MIVLGIDPGVSGGWGLIEFFADGSQDVIEVGRIPAGNGRILIPELVTTIRGYVGAPDQAVIEQVRSRPGQGVSTMFTFGRALGSLEGACEALGWPLDDITPAQWKSVLALPKDDKDGSRQWAQRQWPNLDVLRKKGDGQAIGDALGIAVAWWRRRRGGVA